MRLTVRQLRRIISEAIMNEGKLIDGPDFGPGVEPISIGTRIVALRNDFFREWEKIPHEPGRPNDYSNAMITAFKKYVGGKFVMQEPGVKEALAEFIESWQSGPLGNLDSKDLPAGEKRRSAVSASLDADDAYEEALKAAAEDLRDKGAAQERVDALLAKVAANSEGRGNRRAADVYSGRRSAHESKRRLPSRKLW